jgi:hypothetical protein
MAAEVLATGEGLDNWFRESLTRYGVHPNLWLRDGLTHPVRGLLDGRRAQLDAAGRRLWCCPVRIEADPDVDDPEDSIRCSPLVDLVVFDPQRPDAWALRGGLADWLGAVPADDPLPEPIPVHRHPLAWLRARCRGLVVLTGDPRRAQSVLIGIRRILAEDVEHGRTLRRICAMPLVIPEILVPAERPVSVA